ncbi:hypothetical protein HC928_06225 [bacterium]|nr:hypothetical protein [bacterium]
MLDFVVRLQSFTMDVDPASMLGYASDVVVDLVPIAMAFAGVMMGLRVYRSLKR